MSVARSIVFTLLEPDSVRPTIVTHDTDSMRPSFMQDVTGAAVSKGLDSGAGIRACGRRRAYYRWSVNLGFVEF